MTMFAIAIETNTWSRNYSKNLIELTLNYLSAFKKTLRLSSTDSNDRFYCASFN